MSKSGAMFVDRYGPWALVAGASEGLGAAYARAVAERGVNVVILARRQEALDEVADAIRAATGVEVKTLAVDLADREAMTQIAQGTAAIEVGSLFYCAGVDANYAPFLAVPVEVSLAMVQRNCLVPVQICHHFAGLMAQRAAVPSTPSG